VSSINFFNPDYRRPPLDPHERGEVAAAEIGCFLVVVAGCTLPAVGVISSSAVGKMYVGWVNCAPGAGPVTCTLLGQTRSRYHAACPSIVSG
jgi:hypothetical protein